MRGCDYLEESGSNDGIDYECIHPKYAGRVTCDRCVLGGDPLEIKTRPFTEKFPILYMIELTDGTISTTREANARGLLDLINLAGIRSYSKADQKLRMKIDVHADFIRKAV